MSHSTRRRRGCSAVPPDGGLPASDAIVRSLDTKSRPVVDPPNADDRGLHESPVAGFEGSRPNLLTAETITPTRDATGVIGDAAGSGLRAQEARRRRQPGLGVPVSDRRSGFETFAAGRLLLRA